MSVPVYTFTCGSEFKYDEFEKSETTFTADRWTDVVDKFYDFLLGQGFYCTELDLAEYFLDKAEEVGNLRANFKKEDVYE